MQAVLPSPEVAPQRLHQAMRYAALGGGKRVGPLLGFINLVGPLVAMANTVVVIPSEPHPLAATNLYQVLDTSDGIPWARWFVGGQLSFARACLELLGKK